MSAKSSDGVFEELGVMTITRELAQQRVREHIIKARQRLLNILGVGDES